MTGKIQGLRNLGDTDIKVSVSGLGGNVFGGSRLDQTSTIDIVSAAMDLGVNFIDTANIYNSGESEENLGRALVGRRDAMVIATKFNLYALDEMALPQLVRQQVADSLTRLRTDYIDLLQLHQMDARVDPAVLLEVIYELIVEGKVRAFGLCNAAAWRTAQWRSVASGSGWSGPTTMQNYLHVLARDAEAEALPFAAEENVGFLPYHPLAGGFLTGKYQQGHDRPSGTRGAAGSAIIDTMDNSTNHSMLVELAELAAELGRPISQLALAWVASRPGVASVIAGASNVKQLNSNVAGVNWRLSDEILTEIDRVTAPMGVPSPERLPYRTQT